MSDKPETEAQPAETEPSAQAPGNLDDMTPEQIADLIDGRSREGVEPEVVPVEASEPDEPEEVVEAPEPEPEPEPTEVEAAEPEEDRLAKLERMVQQADLHRQAEAARNEHLRLMLDRKRGEIGHLKNQMQQPAAPHADEYQQESEYIQQHGALEPVVQEVRSEVGELRRERATTAAMTEFQRLQSSHAEFWNELDKSGNGEKQEFEKSFQGKLATELESMGVQESAEQGDSKRTGSIVRAAYKAALAETRLEFLNKAQQRRVAPPLPSEESRKRKLAAASGAETNRPSVAPRPKALEEMTADEIKAEIDRREALGIRVS